MESAIAVGVDFGGTNGRAALVDLETGRILAEAKERVRDHAPEAAAELLLAHFTLGTRSAVLFANPIPPSEALDPQDFEHALGAALQAAAENKVAGKHLTPFLLAQIARETGRQSVRANRALLLHNADTAAAIAVALAKLPGWRALQPWPKSAS